MQTMEHPTHPTTMHFQQFLYMVEEEEGRNEERVRKKRRKREEKRRKRSRKPPTPNLHLRSATVHKTE